MAHLKRKTTKEEEDAKLNFYSTKFQLEKRHLNESF